VILVVPATAVAALAVPASAEAAPIRECGHTLRAVPGSPAGIMNLTTRDVACGHAREFSIAFTARIVYSKRHYRFRGFSCTDRTVAHEQDDVRCVSGRRVIHWQIGA
jgi:hypothetical protein